MFFIPQCFTISTSEVGIIERWGKYDRLAKAGCHIVCPPMDLLVGTLSFRVQELNVRVESKTLDNVFLTATVSVQYCVLAEKVRNGCVTMPCSHRVRQGTWQLKTSSLSFFFR